MKKTNIRFLTILAAAMMILTLAACGGAPEQTPAPAAPAADNQPTAPASDVPAAPADMMNVGVIWRRFNDDFQTGFRKMMEARAAEMGGFELNMQDGEDNVSSINNKLDTLISKGTPYLAICTIDPASGDGLMQKVKAANIPTVFFNTQPSDETMASYDKTWYVGARAEESGTMSAQVLCDYWKADTAIADKNGDGVLQLAILQGPPGHNDTELRTNAYYKTLDDNGIKYEAVKVDTAEWEKAKAQDKMSAWLTESGMDGIEGVLANNDAMALGAVNAVLANGWNQGDAKKFIPVCGIDATIEALESMKSGALLGTCLNDRESQSIAILNVIKAASEGKAIDEAAVGVECTVENGKYVWIPYQKVNADNVDAVLASMTALEG